MNRAYLTIFITYALSFVYMLITTLEQAITSSDLVIFALFSILAMVSLIMVGNDRKEGYILSMIIFAFTISYMLFLFVQSATITRFVLIVLQVISFIVCVFAGTVKRVSSYEFTAEYEPEMKTLQEEKISTEAAFDKLRAAFDVAAKNRENTDLEGTIVMDGSAQAAVALEKEQVAPTKVTKKAAKKSKTSTKKVTKKVTKKKATKKTPAKKKVAKKTTKKSSKKSTKKATKKKTTKKKVTKKKK